ncbi:MAG: hypothetical protein ACOYL6_18515 [Bacteriovoracaceae bacterium]
MIRKWFNYYRINRRRIAQLTLINVALTILSEFVVRELFSLVLGHEWSMLTNKLNYQSLINILMTIVVTNIGGVVLFVPKRKNRFVLFCFISLLASIIAQVIAFELSSLNLFSFKRLIFDLVYAGSLKFLFFEYFRNQLVIPHKNIFQLFLTRSKSDIAMTVIKTCILGLIGLKY